VWENIEAALRLRVAGLDREAAEMRVEKILQDVGLDDIEDRRVALLSGGQKRRLALALEMVSSPHLPALRRGDDLASIRRPRTRSSS
jgi:ABC-type multidrug transport system ATPase subunit